MLDRKLGGVLEIYEKFMGDDPRKVPMKIFPGMHYSMGGLWVDYDHMTNIPGLFAAGEVDYQYHGANRLGANSLLSCLYSGMVGGPDDGRATRTGTPATATRRTAAEQRDSGARKTPTRELRTHGRARRTPTSLAQGAGRVDDRQRHRHPRQRQAARRPTTSCSS